MASGLTPANMRMVQLPDTGQPVSAGTPVPSTVTSASKQNSSAGQGICDSFSASGVESMLISNAVPFGRPPAVSINVGISVNHCAGVAQLGDATVK